MTYAHDFGAVADGKTDDTAALQHALQAGDGVLRLKKGTYRITKPLLLDLTKQGYGGVLGEAGTARIVMAAAGPAIRILGDHRGTAQPDSYKPHSWEKERFPVVSGIEILGQHREAVGIELRKTTKAVVSQVLIRRCRHAVHLVERNRDFVLSDSHLLDNTHYGLYFDRCNLHQVIVHGNHISWNKKAGIRSLGGDVHNVQITGNDIEYNHHPGVDKSPNGEPTGAEIWFEADDGVISEVTIASNTIQATVQPGGTNVRIFGSKKDAPRGARLINITGNVIGSQSRGIDIRHAQRLTVTGNTIYNSIDLSIALTNCSGFAIGSNAFVWRGVDADPPQDGIRLEDCHTGALTGLVTQRLCAGKAEKGAGITFVRCHDVALSESQILDPLVRGVELEDCRRCRVSGNTIYDRRDKPTMLQAIRVLGDSRDNLISNNLIGNAKQQPLDVPKGTAVLQGNVKVL